MNGQLTDETLPSLAVENYLKAIYLLEAQSGEPVRAGRLATRLGVRPASVTGMLERLTRDGLVRHARYGSVHLTAPGRRAALQVVRRHRLLETYLVRELGFGWEVVHDEAEALEHAVSDEVLAAIAAKLGHPARDPHGDPIPSADLQVEEAFAVSLDQLPPGTKGRLVRVLDAKPELLTYLDRLGIGLGDEVELLSEEPYGGSLTVSLAGHTRSVGRLAARSLAMEVVP